MQVSRKIKTLFTAALMVAGGQVIAQQMPSRPNEGVWRNEPGMNRLKAYRQLQLSSGQKQELIALQKQDRQRINELRNDPRLTFAEKKKALKQVQTDQSIKRKTLLTPAQQKNWAGKGLGRTIRKNRGGEMVAGQKDNRDVNGLPYKKKVGSSNNE